jgi:hypothetical protein
MSHIILVYGLRIEIGVKLFTNFDSQSLACSIYLISGYEY